MDLRQSMIERRMVELDPDLAKHYLKYNTYDTQRVIRPAHVDDLANKMVEGLFRFGEIAFAERNGDVTLLVNGQHVCSAVIESGLTVPCILEKFKIKNDLELSELFRQFEILPRSLNDMIRVEANSLKLTWPIRISSLIVSAATLEKTNTKFIFGPCGVGSTNVAPGSTQVMSKDTKVKLLATHLKEGAFLCRIITDQKRQQFLSRAAIAMMIFKTFRINSQVAFDFWVSVRDGELLKKDDPAMKLRNFLMVGMMKNTRGNQVRTSNHEYCHRTARAWNAHVSGKNTKLYYYPDTPVPKLVNA